MPACVVEMNNMLLIFLTGLSLYQVTCKVINVRSGAELPEKCRELALHFETQGTPVMIG